MRIKSVCEWMSGAPSGCGYYGMGRQGTLMTLGLSHFNLGLYSISFGLHVICSKDNSKY